MISPERNELKAPRPFPTSRGKTLCAAAAGDHSQFHFGLTELRVLSSDSKLCTPWLFRIRHQREAVHGCDNGFAEIFSRSRTPCPNVLDFSASTALICASSLMSAPAMNALSPLQFRMTSAHGASSCASRTRP